MYLGEHKSDFFGWDPFFLNPGRPHTLKLKPVHKIRLSTDSTSLCYSNPPKHYSDKMCSTECAEKIYGPNCWGAYHLGHIPQENKKSNLPWISSLYFNYTQEIKDCETRLFSKVRKCTNETRCLYPCEIWEYDIAVQLTRYCSLNETAIEESMARGGHRVEFMYLGAQGTLLEELAMVDANIFISNMGCQLGLWFGGSAVSMLQVIVLVVKLLAHWTNREMRE